MPTSNSAGSELSDKYPLSDPPAGVESGVLAAELERRDSMDQHFTALWLRYLSRNFHRPGLDTRTRFLTLVAQFAATRSAGHLRQTLSAALDSGIRARDLFEAIVQCSIFVGDVAVAPALEIFEEVAGEKNVLGDLRKDQLPTDGRDGERDLDAEREQWTPEDQTDPRLEDFLEKYPWQALSTGLTMKPRHHLDVVEFMDSLDVDHTREWLAFAYQGMYSRRVLDDRTRLLCVAATFVAVGRVPQMKEHMAGALRAGAEPREILEICFLSSVFFGMPTRSVGMRTLLDVLDEAGRKGEIVDS